MRKLVTEIDIADQEGRLSDFVTWQESNKLPYLQACIKEALRMCTGEHNVTNPGANGDQQVCIRQ